jgi:hypothetical protein
MESTQRLASLDLVTILVHSRSHRATYPRFEPQPRAYKSLLYNEYRCVKMRAVVVVSDS